MDLVASSSHHQQLCYVRCSFCNTVLAVGIPLKQTMESSVVTVKCGHCSNLSFLSTKPPPSLHNHNAAHHHRQGQGICSEKLKGRASSSSSSSSFKPTSDEAAASSSKAASTFVVKPPEKKHRLPSAYNRFMKEEIQRIKAAKPEITHREAFSAAAKNWAIPNSPTCRSSGGSTCNIP